MTPPKYGRAQVTGNRAVVYRPNSSSGPNDTFVYRLTDDGKSDTAAVTVRFRS